MSLTTNKLRTMEKKWQTLIEGNIDVMTTDCYMPSIFCIGFTRKQDLYTKKTCYAQAQPVIKCNFMFSPTCHLQDTANLLLMSPI